MPSKSSLVRRLTTCVIATLPLCAMAAGAAEHGPVPAADADPAKAALGKRLSGDSKLA